MSKGFVVTIVTIFSICALCAVVYFLGLISSKQPLAKCGVVDVNGKIVVPMKYQIINFIGGDNFFVSKKDKGFIYNKETKKLKPIEYSIMSKVNDNLYIVKKDKHYGGIDKNYKVVIPVEFSSVSSDKDLIRAYKMDKGTSIFDLNGKKMFETEDMILPTSKNNRMFAISRDKKHKYYIIDKTGKKLLTLNYDRLINFSDDVAVFKKDGKRGIVNISGKEILLPDYKSINTFVNGYAVVFGNSMDSGVIDKSGKLVFSLSNSFIENFSEGLFSIQKNMKAGYIDITGKEVIPLKYADTSSFSDGLAAVENDKYKWGFIDKTGKEVIPFVYEQSSSFYNGYAVVMKQEDNFTNKYINNLISNHIDSDFNGSLLLAKYGVIDKTGKEIIPCKYDIIYNENIGPFAPSFFREKPKDNYFVVGKVNIFAFLGRLMGFKNPADEV